MPNSVTEKPLSSSELFSPDHWQVVTTAPSLLGECKYNWLCTHVSISCWQESIIKAARQAGPCTAKTFPRCFKSNEESSARAHVGKGCSVSMQCKGWPADPQCAQAASALGGNPGIKSRLKKALHLMCPSTECWQSNVPSCIFERKRKIHHQNAAGASWPCKGPPWIWAGAMQKTWRNSFPFPLLSVLYLSFSGPS